VNSALRDRALRELGLPRWRVRAQPLHAEEGFEMPLQQDESKVEISVSEIAAMDLAELHRALARYQGCSSMSVPTPSPAAAGAGIRLLLLDAAPSETDEASQALLPGDPGRMLDQIVFALGLKRDQVKMMHLARGPGATLDDAVLSACAPLMAREIELLAPAVIATLGSAPADVLHRYVKPSAPVVVLTPPSILLNDAKAKRALWPSLRSLRARLLEVASPNA
jgi:uracil-DNA glycosylase